jgi:hypothetical protein
MSEVTRKGDVFEVICPCCQSVLWIDGMTRRIIQTEKKAAKKKGTLDELLLKEKKRMEEFERKFEATAELEKEKREKAKEKFARAMGEVDKED